MSDFSEQRAYAVHLARSDWVLHLDADERVSRKLWAEIKSAISSGEADGFLIPRLNEVLGAALRHGGWYPDYHLRLHRRISGKWAGRVHETATLDGRVRKLGEPIHHYGHPNLRVLLAKLDRYTAMEAQRTEHSMLALCVLATVAPVCYFLYKYIVQRGFQDGWRGLSAALLLSIYRCVIYLKAIELKAIERAALQAGPADGGA